MANNPKKPAFRDSEKASLVKKVADIHGVSTRYVYMILNGDREHEAVFTTYMNLLEGTNELLEKVKQMVPFN
jgi:hypothetical protein